MTHRARLATLLIPLLAALPAPRAAARPASPAPADDPPTAAQVVARVRQAGGYQKLAALPSGLRGSGSGTLFEGPVNATLRLDGLGRAARRLEGSIPLAFGWNGREAWTLDLGGQPRTLDFAERSEQVILAAILTGSWTAAGAPFRFELPEPAQPPAGDVVLHFTYTDGHEAGQITIDRESWLPRRWQYRLGANRITITLSGQVECGGFSLPARVQAESNGAAQLDLAIDRLEPAPPGSEREFDPPSPRTDDLHFAAGRPAALEVQRAPTGHLLVRPTVNGKDAGWFIFDTGAGSSCIDRARAAELGLAPVGAVPAVGIGGTVHSSIYRLETLALGPVTLDQSIVVELDLAFLGGPLGRPIGGIVGFDFISRCLVELDLADGTIALHDPRSAPSDGDSAAGATNSAAPGRPATVSGAQRPAADSAAASRPSGGLAWQKLYLPARVPAVEAAFEDHRGVLRLDTGSNTGITFHPAAVETLKLLDGRTTAAARAGGVGGSVPVRSGKLAWLQLGDRRLEQLDANFATEAKGALADSYCAGVVGGPVLRNYKFYLDCSNRRIAFVQR